MVWPPVDLPERVGPYSIETVLGRGSTGTVYRGRCPTTDQSVAIKVLRSTGSEPVEEHHREIHTLSRIQHPGVVRVLAQSLDPERPWHSMEFIEGADLTAFKREIWGPRRKRNGLPPAANGRLQDVIDLICRLGEPLGYVHGEGWVHRDLKPANVIRRSDGSLVIVDFGLVSRFEHREGREELIIEGRLRGTVAYMAPEQIMGQYVDARADLYALGITLYELVTGVLPFPEREVKKLYLAHLLQAPPRPSSMVTGVPPELEKLILHLLAKQPRDRLGYAQVVCRTLEGLGARGGSRLAPKPRTYLYSSGFVGRREPLEAILALADRARAGKGSLVLVGGESGIGKTRLGKEVGRRCRILEMQVLSGECQPSFQLYERSGAPPASITMQPFMELIRTAAARCQHGQGQCGGSFCETHGCFLGTIEPTFSSIPNRPDRSAGVDLSQITTQEWLFAGLGDVLARLAEERPVLLLLDDFQWADELALAFLEYLANQRLLEDLPVLVLAIYRTEEAPESLTLLESHPEIRRITLDRMGEVQVEQMVREMLALSRTPGKFGRVLSRQSRGNPFFVSQYLRESVTHGLIRLGSDGNWLVPSGEPGDLPIPDSVEALVERRLDVLPPAAHWLVDLLAVSGGRCSLAVLQALAGLPVEQVLDALDELRLQGLIDGFAGDQVRISYHQLTRKAYDQLPESILRQLHRRVAEQLEIQGTVVNFGELGSHWRRAGDPTRARLWYWRAAWAARDRYAYQEAIRHYKAYLDLVEEPTRASVEARIDLAMRVLWLIGRSREAKGMLVQALREVRRLDAPSLEARCLHCLSSILRTEGRTGPAARLAERSLELHRRSGDEQAEARAMSDLATLRLKEARLLEGADLLDGALAIQRRLGDRINEAINLDRQGQARTAAGEPAEGLALQERALLIQQELEDRFAAALTLAGTAIPLQALDRRGEALERTREALAFFQEIGHRRMEAKLITNLASLERETSLPKALEGFRSALTIHRETGEREWEGICLASIGEILLQQDLPAEAILALEQSRTILERIGDRKARETIQTNLQSARDRLPSADRPQA